LRLFILTRHAHTTLNVEHRINGDPSVPVPLTADGRTEATHLGHQLAALEIDFCVYTRFPRTKETAELILGDRFEQVVRLVEPGLDDIDVGDLEGASIDDYREWKRTHTRADPFPGGESLDDAARRYAIAFRGLVEQPTPTATLVVCHEIPIRYALNAAAGSTDLDAPEHSIPNATPYLFDDESLLRAADRIEKDAGPARRMDPTER